MRIKAERDFLVNMNKERLHQTFLEMVAIESPSRQEAEMAAYCREYLLSLGFDVQVDDTAEVTGSNIGNLIARLPGTVAGHIAFSAHMDTVEPCSGIEALCETVDGLGEVYRSAGETILSADDKAGIAAIFEGVASAIESGLPRPDITVLLTTCEEISLVGSSALAEDTFEGEVPCFVLDADGRPGTMIIEAPCHYTLRAEIVGRAAHAGVEPEAGVSAIRIAAEAIASMPLGRLDDATTANIGMIEGGVATNIVPERCFLEGECRSIFRERADMQRQAMDAALRKAASENGGEVRIDWTFDYPEIAISKDDPLIVHLESAMRSCGLNPIMQRTGGGADANVLGGKGARAITLGIGMTNFHSFDEFIALRDIEDMAALVRALIAEYAQ